VNDNKEKLHKWWIEEFNKLPIENLIYKSFVIQPFIDIVGEPIKDIRQYILCA
jgi:hypothetical protein